MSSGISKKKKEKRKYKNITCFTLLTAFYLCNRKTLKFWGQQCELWGQAAAQTVLSSPQLVNKLENEFTNSKAEFWTKQK